MSEGDYDPCECVCAHEGAMRRLISLLRQAQSTCTENQCFGTAPGPQSDTADGGWGMWAFVIFWLVIALLLFLFRFCFPSGDYDCLCATGMYCNRPARVRSSGKPVGDHDGSGPSPPAPPIH